MPAPRPRMLAVISDFHWMHIHYVRALAEQFDLRVAWAGERGEGPVDAAVRGGMVGVPIGTVEENGAAHVRSRLDEAFAAWQPDVVHVMYYRHEELTLLARELVDGRTILVHDCWDPLTGLTRAKPGSRAWTLEHDALERSDAQILVSGALRSYYQEAHGLELEATSLISPRGFGRQTIASPSPKLSARDGRVHVAVVGSAASTPGTGRWYGEVIRRLHSQGVVVHSHFYDRGGDSVDPYPALARELDDYHEHPTLPHTGGTALSETLSRYDLMGVFYEADAGDLPVSLALAVGLPTKAVGGWLQGGIPVVCFPDYRGVVELSEELGIGFVIDRWDDVGRIAGDRDAIADATERCLAVRDRFTAEHQAQRIRDFVGSRL